MTLNDVMAVILRYFTEFGKHAYQHITASICHGIYARVCLLYFVVRARCRRKESSRSLSHLLMSFLFLTYPARHTGIWRATGDISDGIFHQTLVGYTLMGAAGRFGEPSSGKKGQQQNEHVYHDGGRGYR